MASRLSWLVRDGTPSSSSAGALRAFRPPVWTPREPCQRVHDAVGNTRPRPPPRARRRGPVPRRSSCNRLQRLALRARGATPPVRAIPVAGCAKPIQACSHPLDALECQLAPRPGGLGGRLVQGLTASPPSGSLSAGSEVWGSSSRSTSWPDARARPAPGQVRSLTARSGLRPSGRRRDRAPATCA